jgi:hypothetical protein
MEKADAMALRKKVHDIIASMKWKGKDELESANTNDRNPARRWRIEYEMREIEKDVGTKVFNTLPVWSVHKKDTLEKELTIRLLPDDVYAPIKPEPKHPMEKEPLNPDRVARELQMVDQFRLQDIRRANQEAGRPFNEGIDQAKKELPYREDTKPYGYSARGRPKHRKIVHVVSLATLRRGAGF